MNSDIWQPAIELCTKCPFFFFFFLFHPPMQTSGNLLELHQGRDLGFKIQSFSSKIKSWCDKATGPVTLSPKLFIGYKVDQRSPDVRIQKGIYIHIHVYIYIGGVYSKKWGYSWPCLVNYTSDAHIFPPINCSNNQCCTGFVETHAFHMQCLLIIHGYTFNKWLVIVRKDGLLSLFLKTIFMWTCTQLVVNFIVYRY